MTLPSDTHRTDVESQSAATNPSTEHGVSAPIIRDEKGRWVPGGAPISPGRPHKALDLAVRNALHEAFPPLRIVDLYEEALSIAIATKSARTVANITSDILDRLFGKPAIRTEDSDGMTILAGILAQLRSVQGDKQE